MVQGSHGNSQVGWHTHSGGAATPPVHTKYPIFGSGVGSDVEPHKSGSYPTGVKPKAQRQVLPIHISSIDHGG